MSWWRPRKLSPAGPLVAGGGGRQLGVVDADCDSESLDPTGARYVCTRVARTVNIPTFHPHRLRHTVGTLVQEQLGDARLTADTLRHSGLGSVAGYTKITEARRQVNTDLGKYPGMCPDRPISCGTRAKR
jgi:integrase